MSVNKAILVGRLGRDPEMRYTPGGQPVCNFSIATDAVWKDRDGNKQKRTEWHRIVVWGPQAEVCSKYLAKGREVYVEGEIQTRSYEKEGQKHYSTEIRAQQVQFLGGRDGGGQRDSGGMADDGGYGDAAGPADDDVPF